MNKSMLKRTALASLATIVLATGAASLAGAMPSPATDDDRPSAVIDKATTRIEAAVAAGRIDQARADTILAGLEDRIAERLESGHEGMRGTHEGRPGMDGMHEGRPGMDGMHEGRPGMDGMHKGRPGMDGTHEGRPGMKRAGMERAGIGVVSDTLDIEPADLVERLRSGETVADIAGDRTDDVIAAIIDSATERIESAVAAGRIDQAKADTILAGLEDRIAERLESGPPDKGTHEGHEGMRGMGEGHEGMRGMGGMGMLRPVR
jgi:hypothetical protein